MCSVLVDCILYFLDGKERCLQLSTSEVIKACMSVSVWLREKCLSDTTRMSFEKKKIC